MHSKDKERLEQMRRDLNDHIEAESRKFHYKFLEQKEHDEYVDKQNLETARRLEQIGKSEHTIREVFEDMKLDFSMHLVRIRERADELRDQISLIKSGYAKVLDNIESLTPEEREAERVLRLYDRPIGRLQIDCGIVIEGGLGSRHVVARVEYPNLFSMLVESKNSYETDAKKEDKELVEFLEEQIKGLEDDETLWMEKLKQMDCRMLD